jgi:Glycosyl transferase family 2
MVTDGIESLRLFLVAGLPSPPGGRASASAGFRVVALMSAYNEGDIISPVLSHLIENGVEVYFLDNHSTDDTVEQASRWLGRGVIRIETFPAEAAASAEPPPFDWGAILRRKEELANELEADWFIHYDADEIRESPWPGVSLADAIEWVDRLGYNCIDFRVVNFPPTDDGFRRGLDPRTYFRYWEPPGEFDEVQIKAWKKGAAAISLAPFGGHQVKFRDRRVFPIRFLLRHYPIRSQEHGERKVFEERRKRFLHSERVKGWHVQYDSWKEGDSFLGEPYHLHLYDDDRIRLDLLLENEVARTAQARAKELSGTLERVTQERQALDERLRAVEELRARLESEASTREAAGRELARQAGLHEARVAELERQIERDAAGSLELRRRAADLEARVSGSISLAETANARLAAARAHAEELQAARIALEAQIPRLQIENARLRENLANIRDSTSWRWTAPLRRIVDLVRRISRPLPPAPDRLSEHPARSGR